MYFQECCAEKMEVCFERVGKSFFWNFRETLQKLWVFYQMVFEDQENDKGCFIMKVSYNGFNPKVGNKLTSTLIYRFWYRFLADIVICWSIKIGSLYSDVIVSRFGKCYSFTFWCFIFFLWYTMFENNYFHSIENTNRALCEFWYCLINYYIFGFWRRCIEQ